MRGAGVIQIGCEKKFSLQSAEDILPVVITVTGKSKAKVDTFLTKLESLPFEDRVSISKVESDINKEINVWREKVKKLGASPKGLWTVDFDCGDGYLCWKYPETQIAYWHSYTEGMAGRIPLAEKNARVPSDFRENVTQLNNQI